MCPWAGRRTRRRGRDSACRADRLSGCTERGESVVVRGREGRGERSTLRLEERHAPHAIDFFIVDESSDSDVRSLTGPSISSRSSLLVFWLSEGRDDGANFLMLGPWIGQLLVGAARGTESERLDTRDTTSQARYYILKIIFLLFCSILSV